MSSIAIFKRLLCCLLFTSLGLLSHAHADTSSNKEAKKQIIRESITAYSGNCACPYNTTRTGARCGTRSAWNKTGGYAPKWVENQKRNNQKWSVMLRKRIGQPAQLVGHAPK